MDVVDSGSWRKQILGVRSWPGKPPWHPNTWPGLPRPILKPPGQGVPIWGLGIRPNGSQSRAAGHPLQHLVLILSHAGQSLPGDVEGFGGGLLLRTQTGGNSTPSQ